MKPPTDPARRQLTLPFEPREIPRPAPEIREALILVLAELLLQALGAAVVEPVRGRADDDDY